MVRLCGAWVTGHIVYLPGNQAASEKRFAGFFIHASAVYALLLGALGGIIVLVITHTAA